MATKVKTEADTDTPWTNPLILQTVLEKDQPVDKKNIFFKALTFVDRLMIMQENDY